MGIRCVQFLPKVMPPFLSLINSAEFGLRDNLFMQLGHLSVCREAAHSPLSR